MTEIKDFIEKYVKLLPMSNSVSYVEAEKRAGDFLMVMATITDWRHVFAQQKIKALSVQTATYAQELSKATGKTITENKITAEASSEYTAAREELENLDNDISYLKAHYEIFQNAHIFYRTVSKGENA